MLLQRRNAIGKFCFADEALRHKSVTKIVCKLQQNRSTTVVRSINMNQGIDPNVDQARIAQHPGDPSADVQIDSFRFGVGNEGLFKTVPRGKWRIADMRTPVSLMESNDTSARHQCRHLGNNLLRLRNVNQTQAGRGEIEPSSWQPCRGGVSLANLHIVDSSLR